MRYTAPMDNEKQMAEVIEQLENVNARLEKQLSMRRMFVTGVVYGLGFFLGSAILATIALGVLAPYFGQFSWVKNSYETGTSLK